MENKDLRNNGYTCHSLRIKAVLPHLNGQALNRLLGLFSMHARAVHPRLKADGAGGADESVKMSVIEGEDAVLPCEVHSVPPPSISWAKERQLISPFSPR